MKVKAEFHWEVSVSTTHSQKKSTSETKTMDFPVTVSPRTRIFADFTWWDSKCEVPYVANMEYTFNDGQVIKKSVSGTFSEVFITEANGSYHNKDLEEGEVCQPSEGSLDDFYLK